MKMFNISAPRLKSWNFRTLVVLISLTIVPAANSQTAPDHLAISATLGKARILPGEPVEFALTIRNPGNTDFKMVLDEEAIAFEIRRTDSGEPMHTGPVRLPNHLGEYGLSAPLLIIPAKSETAYPLVLNRWLRTDLPPGSYLIQCHLPYTDYDARSILDPGPPPRYGHGQTFSAVLNLRLTVLEPNPHALKGILDDLYQQHLELHRAGSVGTKTSLTNPTPSLHAVILQKIAYAQTPLADLHRARLVADLSPHAHRRELQAIAETLMQSNDPDVARVLMELMSPAGQPTLKLDNARRMRIIETIHAMRRNEDAGAVIEATEQFVRDHPLPEPAASN